MDPYYDLTNITNVVGNKKDECKLYSNWIKLEQTEFINKIGNANNKCEKCTGE